MRNLTTLTIFIFLILLGCRQRAEMEIYIIPKNYIGRVVVIFNQKKGAPFKYEGKARVYEIPETGILKTQFSGNYGRTDLPQFYYTEISEQTRINTQIDGKDISLNKVNATLTSTGVAYRNIDGTGEIEYKECYVGTKGQIEEASKKADKLDILDLIKDE